MATPTTISKQNFANPGNGFFRLRPRWTPGISSMTIMQPDPAVVLTGTLTAQLGANSVVLDLSAGDRWLGFGGEVPFLDVTLSGVDASAAFTIVLL
jgi:hypothetical protein